MKYVYFSPILSLLIIFSVSVHAKSVNITSGSVKITGGTLVNNVGQPYEQFAQFNLNGNNFSFITNNPQPFSDFYFYDFFRYGLEADTDFTLNNLSFPFKNNEGLFATVQYRGSNYSRIGHSSQNVLNFQLIDNNLKVSSSAPYKATTQFSMNGNLLLKCSPNAPAPCNAMIQRVKVFGKGTLTVNFRRWIPSDGQWAWLCVDSLSYDLEK